MLKVSKIFDLSSVCASILTLVFLNLSFLIDIVSAGQERFRTLTSAYYVSKLQCSRRPHNDSTSELDVSKLTKT